MQITVRGDDGDEVKVNVDDLAIEQAMVRLEIRNEVFGDAFDECVALTTDRARELAAALVEIANAVDACFRPPVNADSGRNLSCRPFDA